MGERRCKGRQSQAQMPGRYRKNHVGPPPPLLDSDWPLAKEHGHSEAPGQAVAIYKRQAHGRV